MNIELTQDQAKAIALKWIEDQGKEGPKGYVQLINAVFQGRHFAHWDWMDALKFSVSVCEKSYAVDRAYIFKGLKK